MTDMLSKNEKNVCSCDHSTECGCEKYTWETGEIVAVVKHKADQKVKFKIEEGDLNLRTQDCLHQVQTAGCRKKFVCHIENRKSSTSPEDSTNFSAVRRYVYSKKKPWVTSEFMALVVKRDQLRSRSKEYPEDLDIKKEYSFTRNKTATLKKRLKSAYQRYLEDL